MRANDYNFYKCRLFIIIAQTDKTYHAHTHTFSYTYLYEPQLCLLEQINACAQAIIMLVYTYENSDGVLGIMHYLKNVQVLMIVVD